LGTPQGETSTHEGIGNGAKLYMGWGGKRGKAVQAFVWRGIQRELWGLLINGLGELNKGEQERELYEAWQIKESLVT